jgi:methylglutaconyl-CoA hydratase
LYNRVFKTQKELDNELQLFSEQIASYNPAALVELKKVIWQNTDHWDRLLKERAKISGELVLSNFTKEALAKFKK